MNIIIGMLGLIGVLITGVLLWRIVLLERRVEKLERPLSDDEQP